MRVLFSYVTVGRGGDAVQLLALKAAFEGLGHEVALVGPHPVTPYVFAGRGGRARDVIRRGPWWARDALEVAASVVATRRALAAARGRSVALILRRTGVYDVAAPVLARRLRAPMVVYLDAHVEAERGAGREPYWRWLHATASRRTGEAAALGCAPSRAVAAYYAALGFPEDRLVVLPNGITAEQARLGSLMARQQPPFSRPGICTVGYVGSLARWHRVDLLLVGLRDLRAARGAVDYRAVIAGEGHAGRDLRELTVRLGLDGAVEWTGALDHDAALRAMGRFDVAVLPDTLTTGAPMKLAEYAAMGRPIVAPDHANIRDLFAPDAEIVLVPAGDARALAGAIVALAADPERARRIGLAAQARVASRTWERGVAHVLERLAAAPRAGPAGAAVAP